MEHIKIFARTFEDEARAQAERLASMDAYKDSVIRLMPDAHAGKGCTIGTTMTITDKITPNLVGVDIGCGMLVVPLNGKVRDLEEFDHMVRKHVPCGFAVHDEPLNNYSEMERMASELNKLRCKEHINMDYMLRSIGTLGGGNHFIELDVDDEGRQYLVIHSGSRNLGVKVAEYYQRIAIRECSQAPKDDVQQVIARLKADGRANEIQDTVRRMKAERNGTVPDELAYVSGQSFEDYLHDMAICQDFASVNRGIIASHLLYRDGSTFNQFETVHNYIDLDHMILRKGAVSAIAGERLIIPMNMRDGSLICIGKGNEDWNCSAPHGAGRLMSRAAAKELIDLDEFKESMKGIYSTSVGTGTIDESPMAYKDPKEILQLIADTVEVEYLIKPVINLKATNSYDSSVELDMNEEQD